MINLAQVLVEQLLRGKKYSELKSLELSPVDPETLNSYLETYEAQVNRIERFLVRIEELAHGERYAEKVGKLSSFLGVTTPTALAVVAETGDFSRFGKATNLTAFYGLTPGEHPSGESEHRKGITKAGTRTFDDCWWRHRTFAGAL